MKHIPIKITSSILCLVCVISFTSHSQTDETVLQSTNSHGLEVDAPENCVINPPQASQQELDEWNRVVNSTQGIRAHDPVSSVIGSYVAEKNEWIWPFDRLDNWFPMGSEKQTLCGTIHRFKIHQSKQGKGLEQDWNIYVTPNPEFQYLIDDALPYQRGNQWKTCDTNGYLIEAELTPDASLYDLAFFNLTQNNSTLVGQNVCFYGPWVRERVHSYRPEIHPSEMIWWKDTDGDAKGYYMLFAQDGSHRYDEASDFDTPRKLNPDWKPWAKSPMTAQFNVAFAVNPSTDTLPRQMNVFEIHQNLVVTGEDPESSADADNGKSHALVVDDRQILVIHEMIEKDTNLGVKFVDVRRRADGTIQGYIQLTSKIGKENTAGETGHHGLFLTEELDRTAFPFVLESGDE